ncbi:bifunctional 2-C-methyl-D-erythritol 4-phosphate cytidylyltransferase/2-C-methyl-D-erythritol 2,4-cyclodiphosphate synthase [Maritalea mediterranea]|uniref:Bifunctional enzyme IspD/IspF n=1 Tax=Maritalea mediterranea TaxID=2909667 RepID=A0ABS9E9E1_9HYPH|nr:bifunctional 2-C-methyl-D-erythritol 4-phosphate cytidylyltransferase/2-C-methyl-D-erythritol 2,4-cyclodiphosphate synthase [Maritalea mediterranea]MCF4098519.1 bifunctional 2-C-methyl-D-erythritol 4-phosphate cytidylyltransferase/2-C-methyl-D-erythritol 2,4-cyclodiphosphate synthase [Maritalea mediterranea]
MTRQNQKIAVIIVAAGAGRRMGTDVARPKQYQPVAGVPLLTRTVNAFLQAETVDIILPVISPDHHHFYEALGLGDKRLLSPALGGAERQQSVLAGLDALSATTSPPDIVLIHDAARPFVSNELIDATIDAAITSGGAIPALQVTDTLKQADKDQTIQRTLDRTIHHLAQTPQAFRFAEIYAAHQQAAKTDQLFTDDASIAEWAGMNVKIVPGTPENYKITIAQDVERAEMTLIPRMETRVGTGFDVHAFETGDHVTLGGIQIPHTAKLKGHSDADVALHTLTDALYGAMADGDIGQHFPPSDMEWHQADSAIFLEHAVSRLKERAGRLVHLDLTLICEAPKVGPHCEEMRQRIAQIADVSMSRVSVKATTTEKLGFTGRKEGIAAQAAVTIEVPVKD